MKPNPNSYLGSDRSDADRFVLAIENDISYLQNLTNNGERPHAVDSIMAGHARLDLIFSTAMGTWAKGDCIPKSWRRHARRMAAEDTASMTRMTDINYQTLAKADYDTAVCVASNIALHTDKGDLQPDWGVTGLELWSRIGLRNAFALVQLDMMGRRGGKIVSGPDSKITYEALLDTALLSEFLNGMYDHLLAAPLPARLRRKVESMQGLMLEYDALVGLYEMQGTATLSEGLMVWHIPTSPSIDFGAGTHDKADILTLGFDTKKMVFSHGHDAKSKHRSQQPGIGKTVLSATLLGIEHVKDGEVRPDYGRICSNLLNSHLELYPGSLLHDPRYRMARAAAVIGLRMPPIPPFNPHRDSLEA